VVCVPVLAEPEGSIWMTPVVSVGVVFVLYGDVGSEELHAATNNENATAILPARMGVLSESDPGSNSVTTEAASLHYPERKALITPE
jgi:hypothetical protein